MASNDGPVFASTTRGNLTFRLHGDADLHDTMNQVDDYYEGVVDDLMDHVYDRTKTERDPA